MRHLKLRRRRLVPIILCILFILTLYLWIDNNLKSFIEEKLGGIFNCAIEIKSVKGGIFNDLVLADFKLTSAHLPFGLSGLNIKRIQFNFRIWDILFNNITVESLLPILVTKASLSTTVPFIDRLSAKITNSHVEGNFYFLGDTKMQFSGDISVSPGRLKVDKVSIVDLSKKEGYIDIKGEVDPSFLLADITLHHFKIKGVDLSTSINIKNKVKKDLVKGEIISSKSIMDYKPVDEFRIDYEFSPSVFRLHNFEWAKGIKLSGIVKLDDPKQVDLVLKIENVDLSELTFLVGINEEGAVSGLVSGLFNIKGNWPWPEVEGGLVGEGGRLGNINYDQAKLNIKGKTPMVKIVNSWMRKQDAYATLEGNIDFKGAGSGGFLKDLEVNYDEKAMILGGWDFKRASEPELKLGKDVGDDFYVSFKTFMNDELLNEDLKEDEFGLDYKITEDETLKMRLKEADEFLGVERKIKF